jgi:O-antigen/teichoic acid export membrane protein
MRRAVGAIRTHAEFAWVFLWVAGARTAMLGCSLLGSIIIYRSLAAAQPDMSQAGVFAIAMAIVKVLTSSIGGASDLTVLRTVPTLHRVNEAASWHVVRAAFLLRAGSALLVFAVAMGWRSQIAAQLWHGSAQPGLVGLIICAAGAELLLRSVLVFFQAVERFDKFVISEATFQAGRLLATLLLMWFGILDVQTVLICYAGVGLAATILGAARWPRRELFNFAMPPRPVLRDASRFFVWTLFALSLAAANERMDLFILGRFRPVDEVGLYGGVLTIATIPDFIGGLMATVLQPRVVRLHHSGALRPFSRQLLLVMAPLGLIAGVAIVAFAGPIIRLALGSRFVPGAYEFSLLVGASITWLVLTPIPASLISLSAPRLTTALTVLQLSLVVGCGLLAIPRYGAIGAAVTVAFVRTTLALIIVVIGRRMMTTPAYAIAGTATG